MEFHPGEGLDWDRDYRYPARQDWCYALPYPFPSLLTVVAILAPTRLLGSGSSGRGSIKAD